MQGCGSALAALARFLVTKEPLSAVLVRQFCTAAQIAAFRTGSIRQGSVCRAERACAAWRQAGQSGASPAHLAWLRKLSTTAEEAAAKEAVENTLRPRILRFFAFFMICSAGLNVAPHVAAASVTNCLALMDAQQPFMVKAGCSRLQLLMRLEAARERAAEEGAARKLLRLLQRQDDDPGVADYALSALEALAGCDKGLASLAEAGGQAALQAYLAGTERSVQTEDALHRAKRLVAALAGEPAEGAPPAAASVR